VAPPWGDTWPSFVVTRGPLDVWHVTIGHWMLDLNCGVNLDIFRCRGLQGD